ncbi:MAG: autotransporter strand-loop-strand O-heptosyltransferase [Victivallaceae bacterium]|nr:autotransporter strand-loop-strand O-heptosyltransferase [Victivallaceae bacterium]
MADAKKKVTYSFTNSAFGAPFGASLNVNVQKNESPAIGPEIGPDPRNATAVVHLPQTPSVDLGNGIRIDFCHGFRVLIPEGMDVHVRGIDQESEVVLEEFDVTGDGKMHTSERKYYIPWRVEILDKSGKLIASHDYDCRDKKVVIVVPDGGLGDNLAWLPYSEEFRKARQCRLTCICGEWLIRMVAKNYPEINFIPVGQQPNLEGYACYFCAIFPKERKNWRPSDHQNFGMQGSVAKLLGLPPEPKRVKFTLDAPRPIKEPFVCISTMATNPAKHWNYPDGWNIVIRELKNRGYRVLVIDRDHTMQYGPIRESVPSEAEDMTGRRPLTERMAYLQHAAFFIGLPSGLSWLAWNCRIPVVMIAGFTLDGSEFPTPYRVTNFHFCHGCWNDSNLFFDMKVPIWCPRHLGTPREIECTKVITPKMVLEAIDRIPGVLPHKD